MKVINCGYLISVERKGSLKIKIRMDFKADFVVKNLVSLSSYSSCMELASW